MIHLEAWAFRLVNIQGLQVGAPVIDQLGVVVVVFCGHLGRLVLMWLVHVHHLYMIRLLVIAVSHGLVSQSWLLKRDDLHPQLFRAC